MSVAEQMAQMALPSIDDARSLSDEDIQKEITNAKKELFELRKKVKTRQEVHAVQLCNTVNTSRKAASGLPDLTP